ncbi:hypothetical protein ACLN6O_10630 [Acinetobacter sp. PVC-6A]|nr:hypothetical protein [Acinetobacter baumannii]
MVKKIFGFLDRGVSWAEIIWKVIAFSIVLLGGTTTAFLAKVSDLFKNYSLFISVLIGILTAFLLTLLFYFINLARKSSAEIDYLNKLSQPSSAINPLSENYENRVIKLSDLQLPLNSPHQNKFFKRCQIIGPGSIFILSGSYSNTQFINCGDVILVPEGVRLAGIIILKNCMLDQCTLIDITIITSNTPENIASLKAMGARLIVGELKNK